MMIQRSNPFQFCLSRSLWLSFIVLFSVTLIGAQDRQNPYADLSHESKVFGHSKYYRLYLPEGYFEDTLRYPVIYFFHGWGGRHFKDDNALLEYAMIGDLVDKYQVILVMWDGNIEEAEPRPYNIGYHKDIKYSIQMKDYFVEFVSHIDSSYRTLPDRNNRGIIGFSMGGILSFFLAGKYPDKVCAAVNLAGTSEFFMGYPENHTLYQVRYTFRNLMEVNTRQQGGDSDILVYLNEEVRKGAEWEGNPYEFYGFKGGHMVDHPGQTKAFELAVKFVVANFGKNMPHPPKWSHYDLYSDFEVWNYAVTSDKKVPGFIFLSDVSRSGFGFSTHKWLPDGPAIKDINAKVVTAPVYLPETWYNLITGATYTDDVKESKVLSDKEGRITVQCSGEGVQVGIYDTEKETPCHPVSIYSVMDYKVNDHSRLLNMGDQNQLHIRLFNKGTLTESDHKLKVRIHSSDSTITLLNEVSEVIIPGGSRMVNITPFQVSCKKKPPLHGEPFQIKFAISVESEDTVYHDDIIVPVLFDAPYFNGISIDDGISVRDTSFGKGNGNGKADAGERLMIYTGSNRLRLYTNDPWVVFEDEELTDEQIPSIWEDGYALSSIVAISKNCPDGHVIEFTGNYETNTYNPIERNLHWGRLNITINNK